MQVIFYENHIDFIIHRHYNVKSRQGDCPWFGIWIFDYSAVAQW
jgi:hypothetical protein